MNDEPLLPNIRRLIDALGDHIAGEDRRGQLSVDLQDLVEASRWLLTKLGSIRSEPYTDDELEGVLVDLEVRFLDHASYHIKSLRKTLAAVLATFPDEPSG
jgi:hypothetical protein